MAPPKGGNRGGKRAGSGRKPGTPNKATADIKAQAQKHGSDMLKVLVSIANDISAPQGARADAASKVLDRAYGKAPQAIVGDKDNPIEHRFTFSLDNASANTRRI